MSGSSERRGVSAKRRAIFVGVIATDPFEGSFLSLTAREGGSSEGPSLPETGNPQGKSKFRRF